MATEKRSREAPQRKPSCRCWKPLEAAYLRGRPTIDAGESYRNPCPVPLCHAHPLVQTPGGICKGARFGALVLPTTGQGSLHGLPGSAYRWCWAPGGRQAPRGTNKVPRHYVLAWSPRLAARRQGRWNNPNLASAVGAHPFVRGVRLGVSRPVRIECDLASAH